ncbi:hypothetical protein PENSUB_2518 [Penicillium subrubescens]|uniref:Uncharacterized protein n=1 Tax=Penicillium subrubescens TaxID=1316194 RepID=A0A1Q5UHL0_9EURO|nr:hypothetical protein PENSUB_2518 [Penicillium subrubescens]
MDWNRQNSGRLLSYGWGPSKWPTRSTLYFDPPQDLRHHGPYGSMVQYVQGRQDTAQSISRDEVQACPSPGPVTCTPLIRPIDDAIGVVNSGSSWVNLPLAVVRLCLPLCLDLKSRQTLLPPCYSSPLAGVDKFIHPYLNQLPRSPSRVNLQLHPHRRLLS